jgi:AraC-like DNA-binding protein
MADSAGIDAEGTQPAAMDRLLFMEALLNMLAGNRCSKRQIVTRVVALLFERKHFLIKGLRLREVAARFGISHSALSRGRKTVIPMLAATLEAARIAFDARLAKTPRAQSENPDRKRHRRTKV